MTNPMLPRERCDYSAIVDRPPLSFIVVATVSLAVLVLGWRGAVRGIMALRGRRAAQDVRRPA